MFDLDDLRAAVTTPDVTLDGPFGRRPIVYVDFVASGRSLPQLERVIADQILPYYGNTHTETSFTGRVMACLMEDARSVIARACAVDSDHRVVFTGSGATGAVDKLVRLLKSRHAGDAQKPVVFIGPYEHHSNDLIWRESGFIVQNIELDDSGNIDIGDLRAKLEQFADHEHKYGAFSAASNVTGVVSDIRQIAQELSRHGARFFCDFAAAAPYINIVMKGHEPDGSDRIDAAFISSHKFVGGVGGSGVLIVDRELLDIEVPTVPGGGSVSYVTADWQQYATDLSRREEAGTPNIVGNIRAGYAFLIKEQIGIHRIEALERAQMARFEKAIAPVKGIVRLDQANTERLGIYPFNIAVAGKQLHYGFVVAVLNDLFGIQARGGCSCAGPYGHRLLEMDDKAARRYAEAIRNGFSGMRVGWVRLGINYLLLDEVTDYIAAALEFISRRGLDLLNMYEFDLKAGVWRASNGWADRQQWTLSAILEHEAEPRSGDCPDFADCLAEAERIADTAQRRQVSFRPLDASLEELRWFWLPGEAYHACAAE